MKNMNIEKINEMIANGEIKELHTSWARGYVSRKSEGEVESYDGKFGKGFKAHTPSFKSTTYHYVTYYVYC